MNSSTSGGHSSNGNGSFSADFGLVASSSSSSVRLLWSSSSSSRRRGRSHKCMNLRRASLGGPRATANAEKIETPAPAPAAPAATETEDPKLVSVSYKWDHSSPSTVQFSGTPVQLPLNLQSLHGADPVTILSAFCALSLEPSIQCFYCSDWHVALCVPRLPGTKRPKQ